jgi:hypothetical protein
VIRGATGARVVRFIYTFVSCHWAPLQSNLQVKRGSRHRPPVIPRESNRGLHFANHACCFDCRR